MQTRERTDKSTGWCLLPGVTQYSDKETYNSFEIPLPCFHHVKNIEPEQRDETRQPIGSRNLKSKRGLMNTHLGGTANTSGWS